MRADLKAQMPLAGTLALLLALPLFAQQPAASSSAGAPSQTTLSRIGIYVFPAKSQTPSQQQQDELGCYNWSKTQTNFDPLAPAPATAAPEQASTQPSTNNGAPARGAVGGAAGGAAIGAVAGNAGKGAAIGAATGVVAGVARQRQDARDAQAQQQANSAAAQQAADQHAAAQAGFRKAMTACLQGKGYTVQ
jgi:Glycine-zipper domain